ncbi:MAG: FIST C-terminal domain-containing protein [Chromatiaceae bacterium]|nr:FIST C-terminal domain-containing protein [Chromatiaceae bacterium]MCP5422037.1 FIST C-terminal domain-containing protein [Chromatiaceae bacterium]
MADFNSIHVTGDNWRDLCDQVVRRLGDRPPANLAFVYIADEVAADADRIVDYLRGHSGIPHWAGCVGMGLCSAGLETYERAALSVLTTPFDSEDFRVIARLDQPDDWLAPTADWRSRTLASVAVVHGDPGDANLPTRLVELTDALEGGFLVGGIASAERMPARIADRVTGGGLSGVLFSGRVAISSGLSQGCSLIGHRHRITRCQRNIIETIDGRPALDVFKEAIGKDLADDLQRVGGLIFAALPVSGSDTGDYLVRNLVGIDPDRGLLAIGDLVEPGREIQFARRDPNTARADLERMVEGLKARLDVPARGALYFSCLGRGRHQFGDDSAEMRLLQSLLGDVPLAGFYANGEISHNRLYGYTGVLTLFS